MIQRLLLGRFTIGFDHLYPPPVTTLINDIVKSAIGLNIWIYFALNTVHAKWGRINQLLDSGMVEYYFYSASLSDIQLGLRPRRILLISAE